MTTLPKRPIGRTGLHVTELGFGGVQLGDHWVRMDEDHAHATVAHAYDLGIRYFDTAPQYGKGLSEHRLGHVLRRLPRDSFVLSTKVTRYLVPLDSVDPERRGLPFQLVYDRSRDGILRGFEQSLHRLGLPRIDLLFIHDTPRGDGYLERFKDGMDGCFRALDELRKSGVIRGIGAGLNATASASWLMQNFDLDCLMIAGRFTLLEAEPADDLLEIASRRGVSLIIGAPFNTGILATGAVPEASYDNRPAPPQVRRRVAAIEAVGRAFDVPIGAAALKFPLRHPTVACVVPGMGGTLDVDRNLALMGTAIPEAFWVELDTRGLLSARESN